MDIAVPVGSQVESVDFRFLKGPEIRRLSVKEVVSPEIFDNLGHPVSGGLYDLALGAYGRNQCQTCGLDGRRCMGHVGHISLPVPAYHPMLFGHMYLLLRSACLHCHGFRLGEIERSLFEQQLRLLQHGLLIESQEVARIGEGEEGDALRDIVQRRCTYADEQIKQALLDGRTTARGTVTSTISEERKAILKKLYARLLSRPRCDNCRMYSPKFRRDGVLKIFETGLSDRQLKQNLANVDAKSVSQAQLRAWAKEAAEFEEPLPTLDVKLKSQHGNRFMSSIEVCAALRRLFHAEQALCRVMFNARPSTEYVSADMFFANVVLVPPTRFRLPSELGDQIHMSAMTELLLRLLQTSARISDASAEIERLSMDKAASPDARKLALTQMVNQFVQLQQDYTAFIDSSKAASGGTMPLPGIKQILERKEGLFRKNMMGKRVNYAARSVISPDPNLETNEIGVPLVFATKLTYPEPVTPHNFEELRAAVINGPDTWPGATIVQNELGQQTALSGMTLEQRTALANQLMTPTAGKTGRVGVNKKVYRHIRNGDAVLMNRQPTLHKASMMGHIVRVLPKEKTLRLHYANTGAYNADFDGDEMNMHFPQNEAARAEAMFIANTNNQYLTPTSGKPLRGLIQDHISAGVWLTSLDSFFTREEYQQLVYGSVTPENGKFSSDRVMLLPPAILKPRPLWTGKQLISTMLLNVCPTDRPGLNLDSSNKVKNEYWGEHSAENTVCVRSGELLIGILDKSQYGASDHGLVHAVYEVYGPDYAGLLLSVLGRLFTKFNMRYALTCGMDDLRLTPDGDATRADILEKTKTCGFQAAMEVTNMPESDAPNQKEFRRRLEEILRDDDKLGVLDAVTQSKAGAITSQVVSSCIPAGTAKKFPRNSMQMMALSGAKGSNVNVSQIMCGLGQQALEGRRVPVMVSGKTLPSFKPFDTHVRAGGYIANRFYSGVRPQEYYFHCMAGREGLIDTAVKTSRSGYLQRCLIKQLEGVHVEYDNTVRDTDGTLLQFMYGGDAIDTIKESYLNEFAFCAANMQSLLQKHIPPSSDLGNLDDTKAVAYVKKARKHEAKHPDDVRDPVTAVYNPARYIGAVSTQFQENLEKRAEALFPDDKKQRKKFKSLMQLKYQQSTVAPGEQVGIVASQSIGEPSTQMTLNTFHFAGHGAANVTLGIPRMREIIMTASANIKTPQMLLPINDGISDAQADAFAKSITRIVLSQLIDKVIVRETNRFDAQGRYLRSYTVRVQLYSREEYEEEYDVTQREVEQVFSNKFLFMLEDTIAKEVRRQQRIDLGIASQIGTPAKQTAGESVVAQKSEEADADDSGESDIDSDGEDEKIKDDAAKEDAEDTQHAREDEEDIDVNSDAEDTANPASTDESERSDVDNDSETSQSEDEDAKMEVDTNATMKEGEQLSTRARERQNAVVQLHRTVSKFNFDDENGEWCQFDLEYQADGKKLLMVNIIEDLCRRVVVRETKNIDRCLRQQQKSGRALVTEGVNFEALWHEDLFVDVDGITSNDVSAVLHTYGVEAARQTIVNEISNVFQTYAITVNQRHLDLIADMMTREGTYLPFSRQGLDSSTSPFLKMSFESTCQFLVKTVLNGDSEDLKSPSARIVIGRPFTGGTGAFDLLTKI